MLPNISLVDSHSESDCSADDSNGLLIRSASGGRRRAEANFLRRRCVIRRSGGEGGGGAVISSHDARRRGRRARRPLLLYALALEWFEARVVCGRRDACGTQSFGELVALLALPTIDDPTAAVAGGRLLAIAARLLLCR